MIAANAHAVRDDDLARAHFADRRLLEEPHAGVGRTTCQRPTSLKWIESAVRRHEQATTFGTHAGLARKSVGAQRVEMTLAVGDLVVGSGNAQRSRTTDRVGCRSEEAPS